METKTYYSYEDFMEKIKGSLEEFYKEARKIRISKVRKNNGVLLHGISIIAESTNISPTIYLEEYYKQYTEGTISIGEIVMEIIRISEEHEGDISINLDFFTTYENIKQQVVYKLVNTEKNKELLQEIPSIPYLDMSMVFYYMLENDSFGDASILIYQNHLKLWEITLEELYEDAVCNTPRLLPANIKSMEEVMRNIIKEDILLHCENYMEQLGISEEEERLFVRQNPENWIEPITDRLLGHIFDEKDSCPMYVLTNQKKLFGAACMTYHGILKEFADSMEDNFFVLPSSVHEVILIPDRNFEVPKRLEDMVREVNESQVATEEILTDSVYYFHRDTGNLEKV